MNRLFSASRSSSQFVSKAKMSINKVSHVIFDMDGLLLGKKKTLIFLCFFDLVFSADFQFNFSFFFYQIFLCLLFYVCLFIPYIFRFSIHIFTFFLSQYSTEGRASIFRSTYDINVL